MTVQNGNATASPYDLTGWGGGALLESGTTLVATNCVFRGNSAIVGGGLLNLFGTLVLTADTLSGNSAFGDSSGGAGLFNAGMATVTNTTLSNNSTNGGGGGVFKQSGGNATLTACTLSANAASNGGGLINGGTLTLSNTIVANSLSGGNCANPIASAGHNLSDDSTCTLGGTGDQNNVPANLAPLGNYGGPTQTIALLAGSPAIDHGDPAVCAAAPVNNVDQRGLPRSTASDPICDIGAFEVQRAGLPAPVMSPDGLIALVVMLSVMGWLALRRPARRWS